MTHHELLPNDVADERQAMTAVPEFPYASPVAGDAVASENPYTAMQRSYYESTADAMNQVNHRHHNGNQDYWDILVADTETGWRDRTALDFGCGCGRNIQNLWYRFARMDGVDIAVANLRHAEQNILAEGCPPERFDLYHGTGVDLGGLHSGEYDFVMSTIVLQHICVYEIRRQYLHEFFRVMRPGGLLSFQMGYGEGYGKAGYFDNHYEALETNSAHDTRVTDAASLRLDLEEAGFIDFRFVIRPSFSDGHPNWIFVKVRKP